jgi:hypothetical protein
MFCAGVASGKVGTVFNFLATKFAIFHKIATNPHRFAGVTSTHPSTSPLMTVVAVTINRLINQ